jgi:hypothetical protein
MKRLDSRLESLGAEHLVLGRLLIEGVPTFKRESNAPGYDLVATNPEAGTSCRIQVKARWATDWDHGFPISNFDSDFVVLCALNRGCRYTKSKEGKKPPEFFVFRTSMLRDVRSHAWGKTAKVYLTDLPEAEAEYADRFDLIVEHLKKGGAQQAEPIPAARRRAAG